jgi:peptidyl-prolyl cis-trans isomerase A (cyclophilin A)
MLYALVPLLLALAQAPPAAPAAEGKPAPSGPVVVLETSMGRILIALDKDKAPLSVDNFLKYVRAKFYDGTIFHRVIPGFMIQGGGYTYDLKEKATRPAIHNEAKNGLRNSRGAVAMARLAAPNSATAQFFINVKDNHRLDYGIGGAGYTVFGEVIEGMDVVDKIVAVQTTTREGLEDVPRIAVVIKTAREAAVVAAPVVPTAASMPAPASQP